MNPKDDGCNSESQGIIEDIIEYLKNNVSQEELQLLLDQDQAWESFLIEAELSRNEANVLREALTKLRIDTAAEDKDILQKEEQDRNSFLDEFPYMIAEIKEHIRELHALADEVDKIHRDCTISHVVANSTGVASGILTILGLALAPVTAGVSLAFSATGMGLGAAAAITSVSTTIVEHKTRLSAEAKANELVSTDNQEGVVKAVLSLTEHCLKVVSKIGQNVRAIKLAKANPHLVAKAGKLMTTGNISIRSAKQIQKAFEGTALVMTKGARVMGMATTGLLLLVDMANLVKESKHLHEGAKSESAEELRKKAQVLETKLEELIQIHKSLQ